MKYFVTLLVFMFSYASFGQQLKVEPLELPMYLSLIKPPNLQYRFTAQKVLKTSSRHYSLNLDDLENIQRGHLIINTKTLHKNISFLNTPAIDLKKELRKVMLEIPGTNGLLVTPRGFTL